MHLMVHTTLENQLALNEPPVVRKVLKKLQARGTSRHEALHRIGGVLAEEIFEILRYNRPFDADKYERNLQELLNR